MRQTRGVKEEGMVFDLHKLWRGMLLFMMVSMITPLGSTVVNVVLCAAGGALFAFGPEEISKSVLIKTSLV